MASLNCCMGIYQFDDEKKRTFNSVIKPLIGSHTGLTYVDASSYYEPTNIKMNLISKMVEEARLIVVDLSEKNPNVFLELGIAHTLKKPMVLLCSQKNFNTTWNKKMPFDLEGRELLIFADDNDLKVKLGRFISDSLYTTREVTVSWVSENKDNHIKSSSEIEIFNSGAIWSNLGVNSNFVISYHVQIHDGSSGLNKNPDIRLYFASSPNGYPRIVNIFPWELSEMDNEKYECHIDYFVNLTEHYRLQQVSVGKKDLETIRDFDVFVSFCWPNLVFESTFFEDKVNRLIVPISHFRDRGFPVHLSQYVGLESINSRVTIDNIMIKEIFL